MSEDDKFKERLNARINKLMSRDFMSLSSDEIVTISNAFAMLESLALLYYPVVHKMADCNLSIKDGHKEFFEKMALLHKKIHAAL